MSVLARPVSLASIDAKLYALSLDLECYRTCLANEISPVDAMRRIDELLDIRSTITKETA